MEKRRENKMKTRNKTSAKSTIMVCLIGAVVLMGVLAGIMMIDKMG